MVSATVVEKLRHAFDIANSDDLSAFPVERVSRRRLARRLEHTIPNYWNLEPNLVAEILESEGGNLLDQVVGADAQELAQDIRRIRPTCEARYREADHVEWRRKANTSFEDLIEQRYPGLLPHVQKSVEQLRALGLHPHYSEKRKLTSTERMHKEIEVHSLKEDRKVILLLSISENGCLVCRSVERGGMKAAFVRHVLMLAQEFDCPLQFDHEQWLLTSEEMKNAVLNGGFQDIRQALARYPDFAPFVSVELDKIFPGRAERWTSLVQELLADMERGAWANRPIDDSEPSRGTVGELQIRPLERS